MQHGNKSDLEPTRTRLNLVAHGGPNGAALSVAATNLGKLSHISGPGLPLASIAHPANTSVSYAIVYEGREDFALVAKGLEKMIIDQIESENGLTRRYMNADLKGQMLLYERGYSTRENVIRGVRTLARHLEKTAGYIPKWLDEFK